MKCPLLGLDMQEREWAHKANQTACLREECAWWDAPIEKCLMLNLSEKASLIYLELDGIQGKMPLKK